MRLLSKWFFMITAKRFLFENSKNWLLKSSTKVLKLLGNCREIQYTLNNDKQKEFAMIPYVLRHSTVLRSLMITWHMTSIARSMLSHIMVIKIIYLTIIRVWKLYVWVGYSTINYAITLKVIFHDNCKEIFIWE